jgi:hypothetical protein
MYTVCLFVLKGLRAKAREYGRYVDYLMTLYNVQDLSSNEMKYRF